jgi:hypothetical protein
MNRKHLLITGAVITVLAGALWLIQSSKEPIYEGKPISYWIYARQKTPLYNAPGSKSFDSRSVSFPRVDSNAIPYLLAALTQEESRWERNYRQLFLWMPRFAQRCFPEPRQQADEMTRLVVSVVLGRMSALSTNAIAALVQVLRQDESDFVRGSVVGVLQPHIKDNALARKAVLEARHDKELMVRISAADALGEDPSKAAEEEMSKVLTNQFNRGIGSAPIK